MKKNQSSQTPDVPTFSFSNFHQGNLVILLATAVVMLLGARSLRAANLVGWDIPTSTTSNAAVSTSNAPVSGLSATSISPGTGISINSSSTMWRWTSWNTTNNSLSSSTGSGDFLGWSVTAGARTAATFTNFSGISFKNSLTASNIQVYVSTNGWSSSTLVGSITGSGITTADTNTFHAGTQSFFGSSFSLNAGSTAEFKLIVNNSSSASNYLGFDPSTDWLLQGTTSGGAYNLSNNGTPGTWQDGATGLFTGTDFNNANSGAQTFYNGDNVTLGTAGSLTVAAGGVTVGQFTNNNASGNISVTGGSITASSLVKNGAGTLTLGSSNAIGSVNLTAGTLVANDAKALGAGTLTINGGKLAVSNAAVSSLANNISVGASGGTISNSVQTTLASAITNGGGALTKEGAGKLVLSNAVGASGAGSAMTLNVNEGQLALTGAAKYLTNASISTNATLLLDGVTVNTRGGTTASGAGTLEITNSSTIANSIANNTISSAITIDAGSTLNLTNSSTYRNSLTGGVNGSGNLVVLGGDTRISGTSASTGTATVNNGGTLRLLDNSATNMKFVNNGTLIISNSSARTYNGTISGNNSTELRVDGAGLTTLAGNISGVNPLVMAASGALTLSGSNSFNGITITGSGGIDITRVAALGDATKTIANTVSSGRISVASSAGTGNDWTIGQGINTGATNSDVMAFGPGNGNTLRLGGVVSGSGQLKITGGGSLYINNTANSYTGGTEIGTGRIIVADDNALGANTAAVNFGTQSNSYFVSTASGSFSSSRNFTIGSSSANGYTANIEIGDGVSNNIRGVVANKAGNAQGGNLSKWGNGVLTLSASNSYTGNTVVEQGTLNVTGDISSSSNSTVKAGAALLVGSGGKAGAINTAGTTTIASGGTAGALTVSAGSAAVNGTAGNSLVSSGAALSVASGGLIGDLNNAGNTTISGTSGNIVNSGTVSISGVAGNITSIGTTTIENGGSGGALQINGGTTTVNGTAGNTTVNSGGTLKGSGTVGALEIASGGTLAVGNSPGSMTASSATWDGGGTYAWEINNFLGSAGTNYDFLNITGALAINASANNKFIIDVISLLAASNTAGDASNFNALNNYTFAIATAAGGITGFSDTYFDIITSGFSNSMTVPGAISPGSWSIGLSGNSINLSYTAAAIPEPATGSLLVIGLVGALVARRRHRVR